MVHILVTERQRQWPSQRTGHQHADTAVLQQFNQCGRAQANIGAAGCRFGCVQRKCLNAISLYFVMQQPTLLLGGLERARGRVVGVM